ALPTLALHDALPICCALRGGVTAQMHGRSQRLELEEDVRMVAVQVEQRGAQRGEPPLRLRSDVVEVVDAELAAVGTDEVHFPGRSEEHTSELQSRFD